MTNTQVSAGPLRRLGAMAYDLLLVSAVLFVVAAVFSMFTRGEAVTVQGGALVYVYRITVLATVVAFFGIFWTGRGQTLGMQAWGIRIETLAGNKPSWMDAVLRMAVASVPWLPACLTIAVAATSDAKQTLIPIGLGLWSLVPLNYFAAWFDPLRRSAHDRWLRTRIVHRP
jgi:uncharacterized RDD family membrane protein YckC